MNNAAHVCSRACMHTTPARIISDKPDSVRHNITATAEGSTIIVQTRQQSTAPCASVCASAIVVALCVASCSQQSRMPDDRVAQHENNPDSAAVALSFKSGDFDPRRTEVASTPIAAFLLLRDALKAEDVEAVKRQCSEKVYFDNFAPSNQCLANNSFEVCWHAICVNSPFVRQPVLWRWRQISDTSVVLRMKSEIVATDYLVSFGDTSDGWKVELIESEN